MTLRQVFYVSRLAEGLADRAVRNIIDISRRNNRMLDVTGCLSCSGHHFAQVLEGREAAIAELLRRIQADRRHSEFRLVLDRALTIREYPLWAMAYLPNAELGIRSRRSAPAPPRGRAAPCA
jgi:Sensors of blue-light using FAD